MEKIESNFEIKEIKPYEKDNVKPTKKGVKKMSFTGINPKEDRHFTKFNQLEILESEGLKT